MNTDALVQRYGKIPKAIQEAAARVWEHLQAQQDKVVSVEYLANFNKDHDMSLRHGVDIYKGLVVTVKPDYALDDSDRMWMHPQAYQCRAVFEGGTFERADLPDMNASVGTYNASSIDEIGTQHDTRYTIVDTRMPIVRAAATPQAAYDNSLKHDTLDHCTQIAASMGCGDMVDHAFTNLFLKGSNEYAFFNHAFMHKGIVQISPIMGYRTVSQRGNFESDCLDEQQYVDVDKLSQEHKKQLFTKCQWDDDNTINTYVFRKPFKRLDNVGTHYRLTQGHFASTPIHDKMSIANLYHLTPDLTDLDIRGFGKRIQENKIQLPASHAIVQRLMQVEDFQILNPKYFKGGALHIPRNTVHQLI